MDGLLEALTREATAADAAVGDPLRRDLRRADPAAMAAVLRSIGELEVPGGSLEQNRVSVLAVLGGRDPSLGDARGMVARTPAARLSDPEMPTTSGRRGRRCFAAEVRSFL